MASFSPLLRQIAALSRLPGWTAQGGAIMVARIMEVYGARKMRDVLATTAPSFGRGRHDAIRRAVSALPVIA